MQDMPANMNIAESDLFQPVKLSSLTLSNRIVMAPLTRSRTLKGDLTGPLNAEYYAQRASAGLIISEAIYISPQGKGYAFTPGIYNEAQIAGWQQTTQAVHEKGGHIFAQLWHAGRISHPDLQPNQALPVAPSDIAAAGFAFTESGMKPAVTPRALETAEIAGIINDFSHAAHCAKLAGFDGIELHAANGYLLDQFIRDKTNKRTDCYGGRVENRARLLLEVVDAVTKVWPSDRVGVRLSPINSLNDIEDSNPLNTFSYVVTQLNAFKLAYLHCLEGDMNNSNSVQGFDFQILKALFNGKYIANSGYDIALALNARLEKSADFICFGRPFIGNPDLVRKLYVGADLIDAPKETWYEGGAEGYTDWPFLVE